MSFDDLPLSRPPDPGLQPQRSRQSTTSRWVIVGAGAVVAGAALALWWMSRAQPPAVMPAPTAASAPAQSPRRPPRQPMELPALGDSDAMLRELAAALSRHPMLARLVATRGLVRSATLAVVQIGDGKTPVTSFEVLRPPSRLAIDGLTSGRVTAASFDRWQSAVSALASIRPGDAAQVYVNVKPLFDEAYRELGFPEGDFDRAIVKAVRTLEATPASPAELVLERREGYFEHADRSFAGLQPVQKQLILLGPESRARVLGWVRQFADALELK